MVDVMGMVMGDTNRRRHRGRPSIIPALEQRLGMSLEQYVMEGLQARLRFAEIVERLGVDRRTILMALARRGLVLMKDIDTRERLVRIHPPRRGRGTAAR